jgi:DNA-binding beta-propeller fold protein YncE
LRFLLLYSFVVLLFSSCRKDVGYVNKGDYPVEVGKIISYKCATSGCHDDKSYMAAGNYNLSSWATMFEGSSNGSPVIPFNNRFSSLCYYINIYPELGLQNTPTMPLNQKPLSFEEVKTIKDWIQNGAPDIKGNIKWTGASRKKLYAVNQGCDVVTVFDAETQLPMRYIEVGTKSSIDVPHQVRVSPDGKYWYVIFVNNNIMQKYSCADDKLVGNIPLTPLAAGTGVADALDWNTFTISSDGKRAYVVSWTFSGKVAAVDLENMKLLHYLGGFNNPHAVCLNTDNTKIFVGAQTGNYITEIDTAFSSTNDVSLQNGMPVSGLSSLDIHDIIQAPNGNDLMITCQKSNEVRVYNIPTASVTSVIATGYYPQEIIYSSSMNQYFVSCTYDSTTFGGSAGVITRITGTGLVTTHLKCGAQPHGIAIDESKKMLYVLSRNIQSTGPAPHHTSQCAGRNGFVNFVNLNTFSVLAKKYELSVDPYFIFARP